jgi:hypothetical protein
LFLFSENMFIYLENDESKKEKEKATITNKCSLTR